MLIRFAVENYKSFKDQQIFSMAAGKQTRHPSHVFTTNSGKRLLKGSFFFGANASGKSNFVRALDFARNMVLLGSEALHHTDRYFRIDAEYKNKPGVFQIDFLADQKVFSYGFAIEYLTHNICGEWLYRVETSGKEICIFERDPNNNIKTELKLNNKSQIRFSIYCEDLPADELFLHKIGDKNLDEESGLYDLIEAFDWFKNITIIYPHSRSHNKHDFFLNRDASSESMADLLQTFDTGIEGISKGKQTMEKALSFLPDSISKRILDSLERDRKDIQAEGSATIAVNDRQFEVTIEDGEFIAARIMINHGNPEDLFELADESDGTRRLFDLIPLYESGKKGKIIIVDELDRSFHSKLTEKFINLYFEITEKSPSQLICTTHDLNLMDLNILRQDEIWFVEREKDHSSRIYSLSDYRQRFDKNILNDYLVGRYGAIPCFKDVEWQVDTQ